VSEGEKSKGQFVRTLILGIIPSLQIVRMTGFHAALRQQNISSCSIINAASARSTKSKGPVWADSVEKQCVAGAESDDPN
jgi:hypothetical protein